MVNRFKYAMAALSFVIASTASAGELGIHLLLQGEVAPGVYGQVQIGPAAPPPVVFAQPVLIAPQPLLLAPVYLHVPPGHANNWRKHCREYNACNRPVYFVRSSEYEPDRGHRHHRHGGDDDQERGRDHEGHDEQ